MKNNHKKIIIATGGTGGHVFPAYNLAKHFINSNQADVEIISDLRGLKYLKNYNDIKFIEILSSTIFKKNIFKIALSIFIIFYSILKSLIILLIKKPIIVFGMGGYSSFPVCVAAMIQKTIYSLRK